MAALLRRGVGTRLVRDVGPGCWVLSLALALSACGGGTESPTGPAPVGSPLPRLTVRVTPTPLTATFVSTNGTRSTFRVAADVTLTESAGTGGRINKVTTTVTSVRTIQGVTGTLSMSVATSAAFDISPSGTSTYVHTEEFGVTSDVGSVTWTFSVSGVDTQGRAFTASSPDITLNLVIPTAATQAIRQSS